MIVATARTKSEGYAQLDSALDTSINSPKEICTAPDNIGKMEGKTFK